MTLPVSQRLCSLLCPTFYFFPSSRFFCFILSMILYSSGLRTANSNSAAVSHSKLRKSLTTLRSRKTGWSVLLMLWRIPTWQGIQMGVYRMKSFQSSPEQPHIDQCSQKHTCLFPMPYSLMGIKDAQCLITDLYEHWIQRHDFKNNNRKHNICF